MRDTYTYVAKSRNTSSRSGETEIRVFNQSGLNLTFKRTWTDRRPDLSQFRKSRGTECVILSQSAFQEWVEKYSDAFKKNPDALFRNCLTIKFSWDSFAGGPYEAVLYGKRRKYLGECRNSVWKLLDLIDEPTGERLAGPGCASLYIIPYRDKDGIGELFK